MAVSSGGFNTKELGHLLTWGGPAQNHAGAAVELIGDGVEFGLADGGEVGAAFREVLAEQAVGVFVAAALPGAVRVAEVDRAAGGQAELGVAGHFAALVPGQ